MDGELLQVEEDPLLVPRLQELVTAASAELYGASRCSHHTIQYHVLPGSGPTSSP